MDAAPAPRLTWPDQAKGLGILLVVIGHVWRGLQAANLLPADGMFQTIDRLIYAFHMPLFFALSGLFFMGPLRRAPLVFLRSRLTHILWPLALWTWIYFAFKALAGSLANHPADWADFPLLPLPPREQFWFFWALLLVQILTYLALHATARRGALGHTRLACMTLLAFGLVLVPFGPFFPAEWFAPACRFAGYFALGLFLAPWLLNAAGPSLPAVWALLLFFAAEALALWLMPGSLFDVVPAIGAVLAVLLGLRSSPVMAWLEPLGRASAAIYVAHVLFSAALRILLVKLGVTSLPLHLVLGTLIGVLGPLVLMGLARRYRLGTVLGLPG